MFQSESRVMGEFPKNIPSIQRHGSEHDSVPDAFPDLPVFILFQALKIEQVFPSILYEK